MTAACLRRGQAVRKSGTLISAHGNFSPMRSSLFGPRCALIAFLYARLLYQVINRVLEVIDTGAHFINTRDNGLRHFIKAGLHLLHQSLHMRGHLLRPTLGLRMGSHCSR
ncbi:heat shock factor binding protein 1, putative [Leishmania tarentolae]|uniref:Heat shock factor binding protein 1, putative n=1 Tax=Leishmania tarentolae TaxID=5689 RepID=A0A640KTD1_LEITA|nr:heat shock factor binding protein 1, putative [Leishmania tarentolae]